MTTDNEFGNDDLDKKLKKRRQKLIDDHAHFEFQAIPNPKTPKCRRRGRKT